MNMSQAWSNTATIFSISPKLPRMLKSQTCSPFMSDLGDRIWLMGILRSLDGLRRLHNKLRSRTKISEIGKAMKTNSARSI